MTTARKTRIKVGVIGLGIIGSRVAANLRAAGHQVYVWSRTPHAAPNFLGSVVEVVDLCDFIQIFVSDDAALLEVTRTMAAALGPRHIVAGHATVFPSTASEAAGIVESQGARYLDAPFTGSKLAAQNHQLVYYVGGAGQTLAEARPLLEATSKKILHIGEIGQASVIKIATNMVSAAVVETLAEALAVVRGSGVDAQRFVEAMEFNASRSATSDLKLPAMIAGNFDPHFSAKHMYKDVGFALELAEGLGIALPATEATAGMLYEAIERNGGDHDFCIVATNYQMPEEPADAVPPGDAGTPEGGAPPVGADAPVPAGAEPPPAPPEASAEGASAPKSAEPGEPAAAESVAGEEATAGSGALEQPAAGSAHPPMPVAKPQHPVVAMLRNFFFKPVPASR